MPSYERAMTSSKTDVYTWIADYACRHRLEDLICEFFKDVGNSIFSITDLSHVSLKSALVWMTVKEDHPEGYEDAVVALDSLLSEAVACDCLKLFIRLSLGLRLKDLSHSLSLPVSTFEQKLARYFPQSRFQLEKKYLFQVFNVKDLQEFEANIADVCKYFQILVRNEADRKYLLTNYPQSQFGNKLLESLKTLTQEFFDKLSCNQPLNKLEEMAKSSARDNRTDDSSVWHAWLWKKLSGVQVLTECIVRELFISLQRHETLDLTDDQDVARPGRKLQDRKLKSSVEMTKPSLTCSLKEVVKNPLEHSMKSVQFDNSGCSELDNDSIRFVPSSQGELDVWPLYSLSGQKNRVCNRNEVIPDLRQFLKHDGIRGCMVILQRI